VAQITPSSHRMVASSGEPMDIYENPSEHYAPASCATAPPSRLKTMQPADAYPFAEDTRIYARGSYGKKVLPFSFP